MYSSSVHPKGTVSIVAARRELGRLAEEVGRTGQPLILTRRGRAVARIVAEPGNEVRRPRGRGVDAFADLEGTVRLAGGLADLEASVRAVRSELRGSLERRAATPIGARVRGRA